MRLRRRMSTSVIPEPSPVLGCTSDYATNYNPLSTVDDGTCVFPNKSTEALIVEATEQLAIDHGTYVQNEFELIYPAGVSVIRGKGITDGFQYANNTDLGALIYSYGGVGSYVSQALSIYPTTQMFMPLGSNQSVLLPTPPSIPLIITCGAGTTFNETGYGPGLEFWDKEVQGIPEEQSSFSNGRIAGKLMAIRNGRNCSWWQARYCARITARRNSTTHPGGVIWNQNNGFGEINVNSAIAYAGSIPPDPYINGGNTYTPYVP